jgi:translation factor GUF1, mitochondrial
MDLCSSHRGQDMDHRYLELAGTAGVNTAPRVILTAKLPLSEVVTDFFDSLKHRSSGYASFECVRLCKSVQFSALISINRSYEDAGYEGCNMKKVRLMQGRYARARAAEMQILIADDVSAQWQTHRCTRDDCPSLGHPRHWKTLGQEAE